MIKVTAKDIANHYGISRNTVFATVARKGWKLDNFADLVNMIKHYEYGNRQRTKNRDFVVITKSEINQLQEAAKSPSPKPQRKK